MKFSRYRILIPGIVLLIVAILIAQESRLVLHHADVSRSVMRGEEIVRVLSGNVYVSIDSVDFRCDSAEYFPSRDLAKFYGHVYIRRGNQEVQADLMDYYRNQRMAEAMSNVRVTEPGKFIRANMIRYYTDNKKSEGFHSVVMNDTLNEIYSTSDFYVYIPAEEKLMLWGNVKVVQFNPEEMDTMMVFCDTLIYLNRQEDRQATARGNVRIIRDRLTATCGLAIYFQDRDSIALENNPLLKLDQNKASGSKIGIGFRKGKLEKLYLYKRSRLISMLDSVQQKFDQITAENITLHFHNDSLYLVEALKNAIGKYHVEEESPGLNYVTADMIKIFVKSNRADSLAVFGGVEGTYYPEQFMELAP